MNRQFRKIGLVFAGLTSLAAGGYAYLRHTFLPQTSGTAQIKGIEDPVEVIRDRWGIPHIYAKNEMDLVFAQGFVHAQDRLWQMDFQRRLVAGRLAEILGEVALPLDRWMRILGMRRAATRDEQIIPDKIRGLIDAYTAGVNAWINRGHYPIEFTLLRYQPEPWTVADSLAWGKMMAWTLSVNWESELLRAQLIARLGPEKAAELEPEPDSNEPYVIPPGVDYSTVGHLASDRAKAARRFTGPAGEHGLGSNNWVLSGLHTASGKPLLANDMHLQMGIPAIWYENHLVGGELELAGVSLPGVLGIIAGHNQHVAWGFTNGFPDVQDLYLEHLNRTEQGQVQYEYQGQWLDAEVLQEPIRIKGGQTVTQEVIITRHGPIINQLAPDLVGETPLALRWTALDAEQLFTALFGMNRAKNCLEFREALRSWGTPSQNTVYADTQGNIAYNLTGRVPIRMRGDGRVPVPGWTGEYEWSGFIPFDELPQLYNPPQGYIVTANNRQVDHSYPNFLGSDYISANRARRIKELIEANPKIDIAYIQRMHFDQVSPHARTVGALLGGLTTNDPELKIVVEAMKKWDGNLSPASPEASVYEVFYRRLVLLLTSPRLGDLAICYLGKGPTPILAETSIFGERAFEWLLHEASAQDSVWFGKMDGESRDELLRMALREAVDELKGRFGASMENWSWGKQHKLRFAHTLGSVKPLNLLLNRGPYPVGGDGNTIWNTFTGYHDLASDAVVGPPFRFIADLGDLEHCQGLLAPGQSGHPFSKHYADQIKAWFNRGYHPMIFNRQEVDKATEAKLTLLPS
ncbi:MAG: penicillin acylase family protein [Anaerolineales bacterium]|nr:MAG: penicillin acylase family protein [Anaerolineales bacterium]